MFPDGRRPDVLRMDSVRNVLFIGDAKHVETPGNLATQARLKGYLSWLLSHIGRGSATGIFVICSGKDSESKGWSNTVRFLAQELGLEHSACGTELFEQGLIVTWFVFGP